MSETLLKKIMPLPRINIPCLPGSMLNTEGLNQHLSRRGRTILSLSGNSIKQLAEKTTIYKMVNRFSDILLTVIQSLNIMPEKIRLENEASCFPCFQAHLTQGRGVI